MVPFWPLDSGPNLYLWELGDNFFKVKRTLWIITVGIFYLNFFFKLYNDSYTTGTQRLSRLFCSCYSLAIKRGIFFPIANSVLFDQSEGMLVVHCASSVFLKLFWVIHLKENGCNLFSTWRKLVIVTFNGAAVTRCHVPVGTGTVLNFAKLTFCMSSFC